MLRYKEVLQNTENTAPDSANRGLRRGAIRTWDAVKLGIN